MNELLKAAHGSTNFAFLGEAGCGKSEVSINLAVQLAEESEKEVHFFDLDMTKPLFRSRDAADFMTEHGVHVHYEMQFLDAPTLVGGIRTYLLNDDCYTILDIGGDYIGARTVGGFAPLLNRDITAVFYIVNPYRPWSMTMEHIDSVLSQILGVSNIRMDKLTFIANPNLGVTTTAQDVEDGVKAVQDMIGEYVNVPLYVVKKDLASAVHADIPGFVMEPRLTYEWEIKA